MLFVRRFAFPVLAVFAAAMSAGPLRAAPVIADLKPQVEVVFCLDTTGSMGGLIEGAKQKIWSISNQIVGGKPGPMLKVGLVAYRDRGDKYVTQIHDLTDDLDKVYSTIREFKAEGGGDTPESVNQALQESIAKIKWSENKKTLKIVFLVGDAPPHMDYADDVKYADTCKLAKELGIIVNTVQCGSDSNTTKVWTEIASLAGGSYVSIAQDGAQVRVVTPFDKRLAEINAEIENSTLCWGSADKKRNDQAFQLKAIDGAKREVDAKGESKVVVAPPKAPTAAPGTVVPTTSSPPGGVGGGGGDAALAIAADRGVYNATRAGKMINSYDLLSCIKAGTVKLEDVKEDELPEELKKLPKDKRQAYLDDLEKKRDKLREEARDLAKKRDEFTKKALEEAGQKAKSGFDTKVEELLKKQAKTFGIDY
jgi:Mg-chelatase subunit ChlD